jgi:RNA polymerase sigma-70 factor, ECF subfamily
MGGRWISGAPGECSQDAINGRIKMLGRESAAVATRGEAAARVYCVVAPGAVVDDRLGEFVAMHGIELTWEQRRRDRRRHQRRAHAPGRLGNGRRVIRNDHGRRLAERRARAITATGPELPPWLAMSAGELRFVRVEPASARELENIRVLRLVTRVQAGDEDAWPELYDFLFRALVARVDRGLGDRHGAEDAAQEIVERLLRGALRRYEIRPQVPFQAWLFRSADNELTDEVRNRRRQPSRDPAEVAERLEAQGQMPGVGERLTGSELEALFARVRLPEEQRQVLRLRFIFDLAPPQVAELLGTTAEAVRQMQCRAVKTIRHRFPEPAAAQRVLQVPMRRRTPRLPVLQARRMALLAP